MSDWFDDRFDEKGCKVHGGFNQFDDFWVCMPCLYELQEEVKRLRALRKIAERMTNHNYSGGRDVTIFNGLNDFAALRNFLQKTE